MPEEEIIPSIDADAVVNEVARAVGLAEGPVGVQDIIRAIVRHEPVAAREISRHVELPVPLVTAVCNELRQRGVVSGDRPTRLTPVGRAAFAGGRLVGALPCATCGGRGLVLSDELAGLAGELQAIADAEPSAKLELDQTHCTVDSKLRRVALLVEHGALDKRT